ncbi:hypothetical protein [Acidisoma sp. 7E03]
MLPAVTEPLPPEIPPQLRASVARHQENLLRLIESLRAAGMREAEIESALSTLIDSYKHELLEAIRSLHSAEDGAAKE